jgi:hypothetical protein
MTLGFAIGIIGSFGSIACTRTRMRIASWLCVCAMQICRGVRKYLSVGSIGGLTKACRVMRCVVVAAVVCGPVHSVSYVACLQRHRPRPPLPPM